MSQRQTNALVAIPEQLTGRERTEVRHFPLPQDGQGDLPYFEEVAQESNKRWHTV